MKTFCMAVEDIGGVDEVVVSEANVSSLFKGWLYGRSILVETFQRPDNGAIRKVFDNEMARSFVEVAQSVFSQMDKRGLDHVEDLTDIGVIRL